MTSLKAPMRLLLALATTVLVASNAYAAPNVRISPDTPMPTVGNPFEVSLIGEDFVDLYAYNFTLSFDPALIRAVSIAEGSLLASAGTTFFIPGEIDNTAGTVSFTGNTLLGPIAGATGNGTLAMLDFEAISEGTSPLTLSDLLFLDSGLVEIAILPRESRVTVVGDGGIPVPEPATLPLLLLSVGALLIVHKVLLSKQN